MTFTTTVCRPGDSPSEVPWQPRALSAGPPEAEITQVSSGVISTSSTRTRNHCACSGSPAKSASKQGGPGNRGLDVTVSAWLMEVPCAGKTSGTLPPSSGGGPKSGVASVGGAAVGTGSGSASEPEQAAQSTNTTAPRMMWHLVKELVTQPRLRTRWYTGNTEYLGNRHPSGIGQNRSPVGHSPVKVGAHSDVPN